MVAAGPLGTLKVALSCVSSCQLFLCPSDFDFAYLFLNRLTPSRPVPGTAMPTHTLWMRRSLLLLSFVCMTGVQQW